jgi:flagellar hook-length control protein FliK
MIERIADKSNYGAIDPVFLAPPSREHEAFDAALSRAADSSRRDPTAYRSDERDATRESSRSQETDRAPKRPSREDEATTDASSDKNERDDERESALVQSGGGADTSVAVEKHPDISGTDEGAELGNVDAVAELVEGVAEKDAGKKATIAPRDEGKSAKTTGASNKEAVSDHAKAQPATNANESPAAEKPVDATIAAVSKNTDSKTAELVEKVAAKAPPAAATAKVNDTKTEPKESAEDATIAALPKVTSPTGDVAATDAATTTTTKLSVGKDGRESRSNSRTVASRAERAAAANPTASAAAPPAIVQPAEAAQTVTDEPAKTEIAGPPPAAVANPVIATAAPRENTTSTSPVSERGATTRLASHRGPQTVRPGDGSNAEAEVQRVRLVQRVARAFQSLGEDGGEVRLRLSPPSLGSIRLEVTLQAGVMSARIETETASAKAAIVDNLPALRERLAAHDIKISQFDVELAADSHQQGQFTHNEGGQERSPQGSYRVHAPTHSEARIPPPRPHAPKGELDVLI